MDFRKITGIAVCSVLGVCGGIYGYKAVTPATIAHIQPSAGEELIGGDYGRKNLYGDYLASQFAQQHHDWKRAGDYLDDVMAQTPEDDVLVLKRAMILAMGAGETDKSVAMAKKVRTLEKDNALALLFLASEALTKKDYKQAEEDIKAMPPGSLSDFITPLLEGWTQAGLGKFDSSKLTDNVIHIHHAILMANYLGKNNEIEKLLDMITAAQAPSPVDLERIADIYAQIGKKEKAISLYSDALKSWPENPTIPEKLTALQAGKDIRPLDPVITPEQGVAMALYNMAQLLYQEYADESARVFANIALYLNPNMTDAELLLAAITSRNDRMSDAINYYRSVKPDSEYYLESRRRAADLLEDSQRTDEALAELNDLATNYNDVESLIRIGDIYRRQEDFQKALVSYNEAADHFGGTVPKEYWHLLYARGMSLERLGQWDKAESDLRTALSYQPDHPYVLNYLGYAWTDKGVNLGEALSMIKKAAELRPTDGYITDSLGWVYYRMGDYKMAVPSLEAAVELLPYDPVINDHLGDAYWQAGRKLEARFQWQRARNFSTDTAFIAGVEQKMAQGLAAPDLVKQAHSTAPAVIQPGETITP